MNGWVSAGSRACRPAGTPRARGSTFSLRGRIPPPRRSKHMLFGLINRPEFDAQLVKTAQD
ncbi:hypothetical protein ADK47_17325, partial [Streptomyces rimosus subsp. rimosus]